MSSLSEGLGPYVEILCGEHATTVQRAVEESRATKRYLFEVESDEVAGSR